MDEDERPSDESLLYRIRRERDSLLFKSDWTQMPDNPLSDSKKAEWSAYRQALRDVPATIVIDLEIEFPDPPE